MHRDAGRLRDEVFERPGTRRDDGREQPRVGRQDGQGEVPGAVAQQPGAGHAGGLGLGEEADPDERIGPTLELDATGDVVAAGAAMEGREAVLGEIVGDGTQLTGRDADGLGSGG